MAAGTPVWSSRFAFIMASVGFAVDLGNIWRFPYVTGENGGGAFVIVYLLCVFAIGVPCVMAELLVAGAGNRVRQSRWQPLQRRVGIAASGAVLVVSAFSRLTRSPSPMPVLWAGCFGTSYKRQ